MAYEHRRNQRAILEQFRNQECQSDMVYTINGIDSKYAQFTDQDNADGELERQLYAAPKIQPFSFPCELAHGSTQVRINGFASIPELYARISEKFQIPASAIMYCTLDTPRVDMTHLLGNQLSFKHIIYVHVRGQPKEVRFLKTEEKLGITVTDNKNGGVFIKALSSGVLSRLAKQQENSVETGDLIECINGRSFIGSRHVDVVNFLKGRPLKSEIVLRLISPERGVIPGINKRAKNSGGFGTHTIRITDTSAQLITALNEDQTRAIKQLAHAVEDFLGIADEELAQTIFDLAEKVEDENGFEELLKKELGSFHFPSNIAVKFWWIYQNYADSVKEIQKYKSSRK